MKANWSRKFFLPGKRVSLEEGQGRPFRNHDEQYERLDRGSSLFHIFLMRIGRPAVSLLPPQNCQQKNFDCAKLLLGRQKRLSLQQRLQKDARIQGWRLKVRRTKSNQNQEPTIFLQLRQAIWRERLGSKEKSARLPMRWQMEQKIVLKAER